MRSDKRGKYNSYRGRVTMQGFLRGLIIVLAVVLVILLIAYFAVFQRYLVYTDKGAEFRPPWAQEESPSPSDPIHVVVDSPSPSPEESQEPVPADLRAVWLPLSALDDGTAREQAEAAGANAVIFDMKLPDGTLAYHSGQALADQAGVNFPDPDGARAEAIRGLNQGDLVTVARVSCCRDDLLYQADRSLNLQTAGGKLWAGDDGGYWVNPADERVRAYLAGIAGELAELGFDEILLDYAGYPPERNPKWVASEESGQAGTPDQAVAGLYQAVAQALAPYDGVRLAIRATADALTGADTLTGQTAANLTAWADRIYLPEAPEGVDYPALLSAAGAEDPERLTVLETESALPEQEGNRAVIPAGVPEQTSE